MNTSNIGHTTMPTLNRCQFIGTVTKRPEALPYTSRDNTAQFQIAVTRSWRVRDTGEQKTAKTYVTITTWGRTYEVAQFLEPNDVVFVEATFRNRRVDDQETGAHHYEAEFSANNLVKLAVDTVSANRPWNAPELQEQREQAWQDRRVT